jgi:hypothetical protein
MKEQCLWYSKINVLPCLETDLSRCLGAVRYCETTKGKLGHVVGVNGHRKVNFYS